MDACEKEIIGVRSITLHLNSGIQLIRPDITKENEVNLVTNGQDSFKISEVISLPKWERIIDFSGNYKQNYSDEFTFIAHGINNEIPSIIKQLRSNRLGYIVEIKTTGGSNYLFQAPAFLNEENTKQIDSHSWNVSLSYRAPSFNDRLTKIGETLTNQPTEVTNSIEIQGIKSLALYINEDVVIERPDITKENEVNLTVHGTGSFLISDVIELIKWERETNYSGNYKPNYIDNFTFLLHGIENDVPTILKKLRNNRHGYIAVVTTTGGKTLLFPTPVFMNEDNTKEVDSHSWEVSLSYRVPTFEDRLTLLNTTLLTKFFIKIGDGLLLSAGNNNIISAN